MVPAAGQIGRRRGSTTTCVRPSASVRCRSDQWIDDDELPPMPEPLPELLLEDQPWIFWLPEKEEPELLLVPQP